MDGRGKAVIMLLLIALLLVACTGNNNVETKVVETPTSTRLRIEDIATEVAPDVYRFIDEEAGVVCYVYEFVKRGGISCLSVEQTKLEVEDVR